MSADLHISKNPLTQHFLTLMRDRRCPGGQFRFLLNRMAYNLTYEMLTTWDTEDSRSPQIKSFNGVTPLKDAEKNKFESFTINSQKIALFSMLRTGMSMGSTMHEFFPNAVIGHAGFERKSDKPGDLYEQFFDDLPALDDHFVILYDTDIVTGQSVVQFLRLIEKQNGPLDISRLAIVTVVISKPAAKRLGREFPGLRIFCAAEDEAITPDRMNSIPGLGDIKSRVFGPYIIPNEE